MTEKSVHNWLLILSMTLMLTATWLLGSLHGESKAVSETSESSMSSADAQGLIFALQSELGEKNAEILHANQYAQTSAARTQAMQRQLDELLRERLAEANELALYRRIESSKGQQAIVLDSVGWSDAQPETLELTLVQWQGRKRVNGQMSLTLDYSQSVPGAIAQPATQDAQASDWSIELKPLAFDFRFFQKFNVALSDQIGGVGLEKDQIPFPDSINVQIATSDKGAKPLNTRILWSSISE